MIGIYKIENKINGKSYIGQSIDIERRWQEHYNRKNYTYYNKHPLYVAFNKYGIQNFDFVILEECNQALLDDKEKYYIKKYNSYSNGYNFTRGGNSSVPKKLSNKKAKCIIDILKNTDINFSTIAKIFNVDLSLIYYINRGDMWYIEDESYPCRKLKTIKTPDNYCLDCGKKITKGATRCQQCEGIRRHTQVDSVTREKLKRMVRTMPFIHIGEKFNVSDNTIRKWCKKENIPCKKGDINKYTNREWDKI